MVTRPRAYSLLLRLYPYDYRIRFSAEMTTAFAAGERNLLAELASLLTGATSEWISKFTTDPTVRGRALPDIRMMRPPDIAREIWFK